MFPSHDRCGNIVERKKDDGIKQKKCCGGISKIAPKGSPIHNRYIGMMQRCTDKNSISYKNYGARGITICKEWLNFDNFAKWAMDNGFSVDLQLDRIDNNKGYSPDNCRFVTRSENMRNTRNNIHTEGSIAQMRKEYESGELSINQIAKKYSDSRGNIYNILKYRSWKPHKARLQD